MQIPIGEEWHAEQCHQREERPVDVWFTICGEALRRLAQPKVFPKPKLPRALAFFATSCSVSFPIFSASLPASFFTSDSMCVLMIYHVNLCNIILKFRNLIRIFSPVFWFAMPPCWPCRKSRNEILRKPSTPINISTCCWSWRWEVNSTPPTTNGIFGVRTGWPWWPWWPGDRCWWSWKKQKVFTKSCWIYLLYLVLAKIYRWSSEMWLSKKGILICDLTYF